MAGRPFLHRQDVQHVSPQLFNYRKLQTSTQRDRTVTPAMPALQPPW